MVRKCARSWKGGNGLSFKRGDVHGLASVILRALRDGEIRRRLSEGALRTVEDTFNTRGMVERFILAVEESVHGSS